MHPPTMAAAVVSRPPWCLTPGSAAHDNQPTLWATVVWEWGTMAAVVGNLHHDVLTDVVGLL